MVDFKNTLQAGTEGRQTKEGILSPSTYEGGGNLEPEITFNPGFEPWSDLKKDSFFSPIELDPARANNIYPYRLLVIDVKKGNEVVGGKGNDGIEYIKHTTNTGGLSYELSEINKRSWEFTLPITPQQLNITDQYAISTTATMRGVVEEHNGLKFKMISASGTTGIWPKRDSLGGDPDISGSALSIAADIFGGTIAAIDDIKNSYSQLVNGGKTAPIPLDPLKDDGTGGQTTGYFQAQLLQQFIEQYAMAKKNPDNKHWRLVFDCQKTGESFVVTPMAFTTTKSEKSPGETMFNMQFKAWKRIDLEIGESESGLSNLIPLSPSLFGQINDALDNARSLMSANVNLIKAVRADFRKPFDTIRKLSLLIKDTAGFILTVAELPGQIARDIDSSLRAAAADIKASGESIRQAGRAIKDFGDFVDDAFSSSKDQEGMSQAEVQGGSLGVDAKNSSEISATNNVFSNPEANYDILASFPIDNLTLTPKQTFAIEDEVELNSLISIEEIKEAINEMKDLTLDLTNNFGAGDEFFSSTFGRPDPKFRATPMSIEEFELIVALEEAVLQLSIMVSTRDFDDNRIESSLEYIGGLAQDSNIPFDSTATAKKLVPIPYGLTMQQISARYLGDPDRYNEIITLNNMKSPYIDEDGFFYDLISNGDGRQFNITTKENLFVGQKIQLSSSTQPMFTRKITVIEKITDTNYLISVDGLNNLNLLTTTDQAKMKGYLPGTVNSQNQIYIPSDIAIDQQSRTYDIPFLKDDTLTSLSKIDWLVEDSGDVVLNSFGEVALANGTTNIIQALKMKIKTSKGTLLSSPDYGMGIKPGINVTDVDVQNVLNDLRNTILQDSRFSGIDKIEMNLLPPDLSITIVVRLANGSGIFPINFNI